MNRFVLVNLAASLTIVGLLEVLPLVLLHAPGWAIWGFAAVLFFISQNTDAWKGRPPGRWRWR